jgi:flagellar L-ring protein precursor FlgH
MKPLPQIFGRATCLWLLLTALTALVTTAHAANLFPVDANWRGLTADRRAYRVGDVLTVQILESSSAQSNANTTTEKNGGLKFSWQSTTSQRDAALSLGDTFNGRGQIQRSGRLLAQITVTVREVDPQSGMLRVAGEQQILVNEERQDIRLEGSVRPVDIGENNIVPSTRLANARISYIGDGILGEKQKPGLLSRILSLFGIL